MNNDESNALLASEDIDPNITCGQDELSESRKVCTIAVTFPKKIKQFLSHVTVEPCVLLYLFSAVIQGTLITNMIFEKACGIHFKFNEEVCANLTAHPPENEKVQKYTSQLGLYISLIESLPVLVFILYLGSWSDRNGRKPALLFPLIGNLLSVAILMLNSITWNLRPEFIMLASIPKAVTGGFASLLMICFAYITDVSAVKDRTTRVAFVDISFAIGPILGLSCGGLMYSALGFVGAFGLSLLVTVFCIVYILVVVKETIVISETEAHPENEAATNRNRFHIVDALRTAFKPRENYLRAKLLILMVSLSLMVFQYGGLEYLFVKTKFDWSYSTYIIWIMFQTITASIVSVSFLPLALYKFKVPDLLVGLVGGVSKISGLVILAISPSVFFLYLSVVIGSFGYMPIIVARAIISKLVDKDEAGKVFSLVACLEVLIPLGSNTIFTLIYIATLTVFPGAIFILGAAIYCVVTVLFLSVYVMEKQSQAE